MGDTGLLKGLLTEQAYANILEAKRTAIHGAYTHADFSPTSLGILIPSSAIPHHKVSSWFGGGGGEAGGEIIFKHQPEERERRP